MNRNTSPETRIIHRIMARVRRAESTPAPGGGGNADTVSSIGNLTGVVTSTNRATAIADGALSIAKTSGLQAAIDGKQPVDTELSAIAALPNAAGALTNNGSGVFSYAPAVGGGGTTSFTAAVGFPAVIRRQLTITAAACLPSSEVSVSWRNVTDADENDPEMDDFQFKAIPGTGSFVLIISALGRQQFGGNLKLKYALS